MSGATLAPFERPPNGNSNTIFKSGHLLISSKGLGWKSWKKRWFILTRTSLVFFKNDPSALSQLGGEVNLTLGGIDLNNSGSVVVREDKKLLTVLFPDGRDGRAFTLKAETFEDLYEWKTALEHALAQAPNAALVMGHNGIFRNDTNDSIEGSFHQWREKRPLKSLVVGRPILLALEDIDGSPSFLEKALRFLEKYGIKEEGILRQSADVSEVERRVQEYEQGKIEFEPEEDAHVIGDCVKHFLRELPSSPVPSSCCTALLEAYKINLKEARVNAMRTTIQEAFPDPNRCLLQRVLKMMHTISSHVSENRMTASAVSACMAPLLLRPLLAGECELEDDFDMNGDNSAQLLAAANAATNAQAIITLLLEEYENVFDDESLRKCSMSVDSLTDKSKSEDTSDDDDDCASVVVNGFHDAENEAERETDFDRGRRLSGKLSESSASAASDLYDYKAIRNGSSDDEAPAQVYTSSTKSSPKKSVNERLEKPKKSHERKISAPAEISSIASSMELQELYQSAAAGSKLIAKNQILGLACNTNTSLNKSNLWGRKYSRRTPSVESIDSSGEEELAIHRLDIAKTDLSHRIAKEARGNAILQASLERRKQALHERRLALEQDVLRLQEQLQAERDLRAALELGLSMSSGQFHGARGMDSKTRAELQEIALAEADVARLKQEVAELHHQLNQQRQSYYSSLMDSYGHYQRASAPPRSQSSQPFRQPDFDTTLAVCNHERKQKTEELIMHELRSMKGQLLASDTNSRAHSRKHFREPSLSDSKSIIEASTSHHLSMHDFVSVSSALSSPSASRVAEVMNDPRYPSTASLTLLELTTYLNFFKERRSQLMEQLHRLDLNYGSIPHEFVYKPSSPPWN